MDAVITLVAPERAGLGAACLKLAAEALANGPAEPVWLGRGIAADLGFSVDASNLAATRNRVAEALSGQSVDFAVQARAARRKRLLLADMDSTMIGQECIDELGRAAGIGDRIAAVTERAMRGEIEFEAALSERVALLAGMPEATLGDVYRDFITPNAGARILVRTMRAHGARTQLVSGGFTFFADRVAAAIGFEAVSANVLEIDEGRLNGRVHPPVLGADAKLAALRASASELGIGLEATLAVGDGANDLGMIEAAGLGVAYRAKPIVAARADARVEHSDLTAILYFQGYRAEEFVDA